MQIQRIVLWGTMVMALLVRLPGIGWGLPPTTEQVKQSDLRSSYAFDEDDILSGVAKADVRRFDFDPNEYHWGTLHSELVLLALDGAQAVGAFHVPWREAYYSLTPEDFSRVYVAGRLVAVAMALLTIWILFSIGGWPGAFAAMLVAVSPSHMLQSDQVRVDVTMTAMLALTVLLANRAATTKRFLFLGVAGGLTIAAKYSAISAVAAVLLAVFILSKFPWRGILVAAGGAIAGFLAGSPYILIKPRAYYDEIERYMTANSHIPAQFLIAPLKLLALNLLNLARFSMGLPALLLAIAGIVWMVRRRSRVDWIVMAAIAGYVAILFPLHWPLIRYNLPLVVLLGLCAGVAMERFPKGWRIPIAAAALVMPIAGCIAQIDYMRSPQTADQVLARILIVVPPGNAISRLMPEAPALDRKVYPMGPSLYAPNFATIAPDWVLTTDLNDAPFPDGTQAALRSYYDEIAHFENPGILRWSTFGESGAPQDWKYTHCSYTLFRKKPQ